MELKNARKGRKFEFYFAVVTSILIAAAIIFTTFYSTNCINLLINDFKESASGYDNCITRMMVTSFMHDLKSGEYHEVNDTVAFLKKNDYIRYAYAYNVNTGKIFWSSTETFLNQTQTELQDSVLPVMNGIENEVSMRELRLGDNHLVVGLVLNKAQAHGYKNLFDNLRLFVILFILLGAAISMIMSRKINKPIKDLISGVQEFGKGNFEHELKQTGFEELDMLIDAYNHMASQLHELYNSLETKVENRTRELEAANQKLKETQTMMVHSEKMRSLGELVAGIAHEINNPINFIYGNIMILNNYQNDLIELIDKYTALEGSFDDKSVEDINNFKQKIDLEFLKTDIVDLIKSCLEGVERTKNIVLDLKNFSRMDEMVFSECDLAKEIDTTLNILSNKIKNRIEIHKEYEENLPKIEAYVGQLNQVFMNIIDNAQGAIKGTGDIFIRIKSEPDNNISIQFEDTGCGIKPENLNKIFEPFYTTKPVGQGTGLGMSIAYRVIEAHNGKITAESEVGKGTKITIHLPVNHNNENQEVIDG